MLAFLFISISISILLEVELEAVIDYGRRCMGLARFMGRIIFGMGLDISLKMVFVSFILGIRVRIEIFMI